MTEPKKTEKRVSLPLTEALVLDIVDFLLDNKGYGFSNEISYFIVQNKPRRYTSREVVGILRNRPMFRHAQTSERKGGIRWRLDMLALQKYLTAKGYNAKARERQMYDKMRDLKWQQLKTTIEVLEEIEPDSIDECYESVAMIWA
tara:strand:- start:1315 stop:1749 length:435 start_codon:yes stop_codon:yes gene_type:complete